MHYYFLASVTPIERQNAEQCILNNEYDYVVEDLLRICPDLENEADGSIDLSRYSPKEQRQIVEYFHLDHGHPERIGTERLRACLELYLPSKLSLPDPSPFADDAGFQFDGEHIMPGSTSAALLAHLICEGMSLDLMKREIDHLANSIPSSLGRSPDRRTREPAVLRKVEAALRRKISAYFSSSSPDLRSFES